MNNSTLAKLDTAARLLAEARTFEDFLGIRNIAIMAETYTKAAKLGLEAQNRAAEVKIRAERKAGELFAQLERDKGGRPENSCNVARVSEYTQALEDAELTRFDASRWQTIAGIPEPKFEAYIAEAKDDGKELTTAGIVRAAKPAHVSYSSGENEWYTPPAYIEAARRVMGCIDVDPASSVIANRVVRATTFYDLESDGLAHEWNGRIWLNPPYAQPLVVHFADKLAVEIDAGRVKQACVLVNNATETVWFQTMLLYAQAMCLPRGRIKFIDHNGEATGAPLQGQVILYFGPNIVDFSREFEQFGKVMYAG
jgi:ParB family chromosome partitioning protein